MAFQIRRDADIGRQETEELEAESRKLKQLLADAHLNNAGLRNSFKKW
jgi:hypothetical protein